MAATNRRPVLNALILLVALGTLGGVAVWMANSGAPDGPAEPGEPAEPDEPGETGVSASLVVPAFEPFSYDVARLEAEWRAERERLGEHTVGPDEQRLIEEFYRINAQSLDSEATAAQVAALSDLLVVSASEYVRRHGPRAWRALSWELVAPFQEALTEALELAGETGQPPTDLVRAETPQGQRLRERLGNFFTVAERTGLVDQAGALTVDPTLAAVLFRYRWFGFAQDYANLSLMTPFERLVLWRWRIEAAVGLPLQQRLALVSEIGDLYAASIDPNAVRGILYYQAGEPEQARIYFRRARRSQPDDPRYGVWEEAAAAGRP